jgi:hypothetical protein
MKNNYEIRGEVTAIFLRRRDGTRLETLIDTADLPRAMEAPFAWSAHWDKNTQSFYVEGKTYKRGEKRVYHSLHRWIMQPPQGYEVDHIFHDTLDNRRSMLRVLPKGANQQNCNGARRHNNSSGIRGVTWSKKLNKWVARFRVNGKTYHIGVFVDLAEAERAITAARAKYLPYSIDALDPNVPELHDIIIPCFETGIASNNTTGHRGLVYEKRIKKWFGKAQRKGNIATTGYYENKLDAHMELIEKIKLLEASL